MHTHTHTYTLPNKYTDFFVFKMATSHQSDQLHYAGTHTWGHLTITRQSF